jgi:ribonuclease HI
MDQTWVGTSKEKVCGRNDKVDWWSGFSANIGIIMANVAEWWGVIHSFELVWEAGFTKIILEMDNVGIDIAINNIFLVLTCIISCPKSPNIEDKLES